MILFYDDIDTGEGMQEVTGAARELLKKVEGLELACGRQADRVRELERQHQRDQERVGGGREIIRVQDDTIARLRADLDAKDRITENQKGSIKDLYRQLDAVAESNGKLRKGIESLLTHAAEGIRLTKDGSGEYDLASYHLYSYHHRRLSALLEGKDGCAATPDA